MRNDTPQAPISTSRSTRSGACAAIEIASPPPKLLPTIEKVSRPSASAKPSRWARHASSE